MMYNTMEARIIAEAANRELSARTALRHYGATAAGVRIPGPRTPAQVLKRPGRERFGRAMATLRAWQVRVPRLLPRQA